MSMYRAIDAEFLLNRCIRGVNGGRMEFKMLYWYWLIFGMLLVMAEIFIPSFTIFWFGLGAVFVGGLLWLLPDMSHSWQLFIWAFSSSAFTVLWFKIFKPLMVDKTKAGISREAVLGETGMVVKVPHNSSRGIVRFSTPLLGSDEWPFICVAPIEVGERVVIKDISGNTLVVDKISQ